MLTLSHAVDSGAGVAVISFIAIPIRGGVVARDEFAEAAFDHASSSIVANGFGPEAGLGADVAPEAKGLVADCKLLASNL